MFGEHSYLGYTLIFCVPPLLLLWLRREFCRVMRRDLRRILVATAVLTLYGSLIWPIALHYGAWAYGGDRLLGIEVLGYVYVEDVLWWFLVSFLFASYVSLSTWHEERGRDVLLTEARGLLASFRNALRGFRAISLERNSTVHASVAAFVLLEGFFLRITAIEWLFVVLAIGSVMGFELLNTAVERLASKVEPCQDEQVRLVKDAAAAGVLVSAAAAAVVGLVIFFSRIVAELA